jgi:tetratricopeptide (TPR) repeat protein
VYDDALKVIELAPGNRMGYELRGHAYLEVGQYQAAIADFTRAISIDPNAIYDYRMRGRAYHFLNQFDNAMADFEAAFESMPRTAIRFPSSTT